MNGLIIVIILLSSIRIELDYEILALIFLSSLIDIWSAIVTTVNSLSRSTKINFDDVHDLVLNEDIIWREFGELSSSSV